MKRLMLVASFLMIASCGEEPTAPAPEKTSAAQILYGPDNLGFETVSYPSDTRPPIIVNNSNCDQCAVICTGPTFSGICQVIQPGFRLADGTFLKSCSPFAPGYDCSEGTFDGLATVGWYGGTFKGAPGFYIRSMILGKKVQAVFYGGPGFTNYLSTSYAPGLSFYNITKNIGSFVLIHSP